MHAVDALETALSIYIDDRRDIPKPSALKGRQRSVTLPALTEAKLALRCGITVDRKWRLPDALPFNRRLQILL
jgi:hypothetical protein